MYFYTYALHDANLLGCRFETRTLFNVKLEMGLNEQPCYPIPKKSKKGRTPYGYGHCLVTWYNRTEIANSFQLLLQGPIPSAYFFKIVSLLQIDFICPNSRRHHADRKPSTLFTRLLVSATRRWPLNEFPTWSS